MSLKNFLAFDLGAESGRAVVGTLDGGHLILAEKHRFLNPTGRMNGHFHWNLLAQWEELKVGLRKAVAPTADLPGLTLQGIGVDTWGVDFGFIGPDGGVVGYPYHYRDKRNQQAMETAFTKVGRNAVFEATGIQFMSINSLVQLIAAAKSQPKLLDAASRLLFMPDLFNYLLTGVAKNEFSIASTSQMYDPRKRDWARPLLKELGLPDRLLGEIIPSGTVIGELLPEVVSECGVRGAIPVIAPACHDTASAVAAVPAEGTDWCYISSGTWSLMGIECDEPIINEKSLRYNYTNEGGVNGTIRFLKNLMGLWPVQECRRHWLRAGREHDYTDLTEMAARSAPHALLLNLDHGPFSLPGEMPAKIEAFARQTGQHSPGAPGETIRACLDSLALTYRKTLEGLEDIVGHRIGTIYIVGGGAMNALLNQMTADACRRTVVAGPVEATAIGNVLVQAMATGDVSSLSEARSIVRESFDVKRYEPQNSAIWDAAYERFKKLKQ